MLPLALKIMVYQVEWAIPQKILIQKNLKHTNFQFVLQSSSDCLKLLCIVLLPGIQETFQSKYY